MTPKKKPASKPITVSIRFPVELYEQIVQGAQANNRSFNQEVIYRLAQKLREPGEGHDDASRSDDSV